MWQKFGGFMINKIRITPLGSVGFSPSAGLIGPDRRGAALEPVALGIVAGRLLHFQLQALQSIHVKS